MFLTRGRTVGFRAPRCAFRSAQPLRATAPMVIEENNHTPKCVSVARIHQTHRVESWDYALASCRRFTP